MPTADADLDLVIDEEKGERPVGPHIRCPLCGWAPRKKDVWQCSCGHIWNTFDTGGVCPACLYAWIQPSVFAAIAGRRILTGTPDRAEWEQGA